MNSLASGSALLPVRSPLRQAIRFVFLNYNKGPFLALHFAVILVLFVPITWPAVAMCVGFYYLRMFGISAGFHRYFAHRSYRTSRPFQFMIAALAAAPFKKAPSGGRPTTDCTTNIRTRKMIHIHPYGTASGGRISAGCYRPRIRARPT